jgi:polysaccharide biosynthesis/export protein
VCEFRNLHLSKSPSVSVNKKLGVEQTSMNRRISFTTPGFTATARRRFFPAMPLVLALSVAALFAGCKEQSSFNPPNAPKMTGAQTGDSIQKSPESMTLREGDVLRVLFPGSPSLDSTPTIGRDGKINLPLIGDVDAAGLTTPELEKKLVDLYAPQLSSKQITVQVQSSSFPFYVTGMVLHPGKILSDHPITALEAVMEAGGFDYAKADLKDVTVIRRENSVMKNYKLNLKAVLNGRQTSPFYLKPDDIVYVPERFTVF